MIISCASCNASYEVEPSFFEPDGLKVKCSNCATVWFQGYISEDDLDAFVRSYSEEEPEDEAPEEAPVEEEIVAEASVQNEAPTSKSRIRSEALRLVAAAQNLKTGRLQHDKQFRKNVINWGSLAATVLIFAGVALQYRVSVVRMLPGAAQLYASLGMPVNVRGMSFANIVFKRGFENGLPIIAIKGEVVNLTDEQQVLPRVRLGLLDDTDQELYHWTVRVSKKPIEPGGKLTFVTRLASPPASAQGLMVRFAQATSGHGVYR